MNKKTKKRIAVLRVRVQKLEKMLAGAKEQCDDEQEVRDLQQQIAVARDELSVLAG